MARRRRPSRATIAPREGVTPALPVELRHRGRTVQPRPGTWSPEAVAAAMREWAQVTGSPPRSLDFCPSSERSMGRGGNEPTRWEREQPRWPSSTTVYRFYPSWGDALDAAGLPASASRSQIGDLRERVMAARRMAAAGRRVAEIAHELGVTAPTARRYLSTHDCSSCEDGLVVGDGAICKRCATRQANPRRWPADEVTALVREWVVETGRPPRSQEWQPRPQAPRKWDLEFPRWPRGSVGKIVFGSWGALLLAAGQDAYNQRWSREEVLEAIRAWHRRTGRAPAKPEWDTTDASHPSSATVRRMFGGFVAAVREAGLEPAGRRFSDDQLLDAICTWEAERGRPLRPTDWITACPPWPSSATVAVHFGSFAAGLAAARERSQ